MKMRQLGCNGPQVLAQGDDIVPIPGTKRRKYLEKTLEPWRYN